MTTAQAISAESLAYHQSCLEFVRMLDPWMPIGTLKWIHWSFSLRGRQLREGLA